MRLLVHCQILQPIFFVIMICDRCLKISSTNIRSPYNSLKEDSGVTHHSIVVR